MKMTTCCTSAIVPVEPCIADRLSARIATNRPVVLKILIRNIVRRLRLWTSSSPHISQPTKFNYGTMQLYHSLSSSSFLKSFLVPALPALPPWTALFQFARRLRGILLPTQEAHRIMAGQNHQRTTLYNNMILSCHDSVSLGCGWPRCGII